MLQSVEKAGMALGASFHVMLIVMAVTMLLVNVRSAVLDTKDHRVTKVSQFDAWRYSVFIYSCLTL